jgi:hypothetical protein
MMGRRSGAGVGSGEFRVVTWNCASGSGGNSVVSRWCYGRAWGRSTALGLRLASLTMTGLRGPQSILRQDILGILVEHK